MLRVSAKSWRSIGLGYSGFVHIAESETGEENCFSWVADHVPIDEEFLSMASAEEMGYTKNITPATL